MEIRKIEIESLKDLKEAQKILPKEIFEEVFEEIVKEIGEDTNVRFNKEECANIIKERRLLSTALIRVNKAFNNLMHADNRDLPSDKIRKIRKALNSISEILEKTYKEVK